MKNTYLLSFIFASFFIAPEFLYAQDESAAFLNCLNTCAGTCQENTSTGAVTCSVEDPATDSTTQTTQETSTTNTATQTTTSQGSPGAGFVALAPIPGLTDSGTAGSVINSQSLAQFFNNLYIYLIGIAAALAVIEIIWGGLLYATTDSVGNKEQGKEKIRMAIFGLVLVLSPALVFSIINPRILNLSVNLQKLDLTVTPIVGSGTGTAASTAEATSSGCSTSKVGFGAVGSIAVACPTPQAAEAFRASCTNGGGAAYSTGDSSLPYGASCSLLNPMGRGREYSATSEIPQGYWCYTTTINQGGQGVINYGCQVNKDSCDNLINNHPIQGTYRAGCQPY